MADNGGGGSSVGIVAIFAIFLIVVIAAGSLFFPGRIFNLGTKVNVTAEKDGWSDVKREKWSAGAMRQNGLRSATAADLLLRFIAL
jgi:hypothetical protein